MKLEEAFKVLSSFFTSGNLFFHVHEKNLGHKPVSQNVYAVPTLNFALTEDLLTLHKRGEQDSNLNLVHRLLQIVKRRASHFRTTVQCFAIYSVASPRAIKRASRSCGFSANFKIAWNKSRNMRSNDSGRRIASQWGVLFCQCKIRFSRKDLDKFRVAIQF